MQKPRRFHELLREARERARQSTEVMGILLNIEEDHYRAIEDGAAFPDNETLRRLCMMLEWNLYDAQRLINNEVAARPGSARAGDEAALRALQSVPLDGTAPPGPGRDSLGARLREVRETTGQLVDIIAMLLGITAEQYRRLEAGEPPGDDLLRRISMVYDWNYLDLLSLLRTEQAHALQPHRIGSPYPGNSVQGLRLKSLVQELESLFASLPERDQQFVLTQLELVRETMRKLRHAS
jgi:transcriptional regulator with XRE-family HTH domain